MRIGKSFALIIIILLSVSCTTSIKRSRIVTETPLYQQEIEGLMQTYVAAINSQNWISASNQHYIARCKADSISARAKFFKYSYDGRLNSKLALESLDFQTRKIAKEHIELALFTFRFQLDVDISSVPYSNAQLKENYINGLRHVFGKDIIVRFTDDNSIQAGNLRQTLLAVNNHNSDCPDWKIMEFSDASQAYLDAVFDIDTASLIAAHQR